MLWKYNKKKHDFINLEEFKEKLQPCLEVIKKFLNHKIFPVKENNKKSIDEEDNEDILLII